MLWQICDSCKIHSVMPPKIRQEIHIQTDKNLAKGAVKSMALSCSCNFHKTMSIHVKTAKLFPSIFIFVYVCLSNIVKRCSIYSWNQGNKGDGRESSAPSCHELFWSPAPNNFVKRLQKQKTENVRLIFILFYFCKEKRRRRSSSNLPAVSTWSNPQICEIFHW